MKEIEEKKEEEKKVKAQIKQPHVRYPPMPREKFDVNKDIGAWIRPEFKEVINVFENIIKEKLI